MTEKARALGMKRTTFRNASGLPNSSQKTTALDMAILGQSLMRDFPDEYEYFATTKFVWRGVSYKNHNKLLGKYEGTTGIKTGYTNASGFNLTAAVQRNGYNIIAVVLGGRTSKSRDAHMISLLDLQFSRLKDAPLLATRGPIMARLPDPRQRPSFIVAEALAAPTSADAIALAALIEPLQAEENAARHKPSVLPKIASMSRASFIPIGDPIGDAIAALTEGPQDEANEATEVELASLELASGEGDIEYDASDLRVISWLGEDEHWGIQIGAFAAMESAAARLSAAAALAPEELETATPAIVPANNEGATLYRARFGPFEEKEARLACETLTSRGIKCVPVKEGVTPIP